MHSEKIQNLFGNICEEIKKYKGLHDYKIDIIDQELTIKVELWLNYDKYKSQQVMLKMNNKKTIKQQVREKVFNSRYSVKLKYHYHKNNIT
jgi:hypothetical protein